MFLVHVFESYLRVYAGSWSKIGNYELVFFNISNGVVLVYIHDVKDEKPPKPLTPYHRGHHDLSSGFLITITSCDILNHFGHFEFLGVLVFGVVFKDECHNREVS